MGKKVVNAEKDSKGNITSVRLSGNKTNTDIKAAIRMAEKGQIDNAHPVKKRDGSSYLRTNPDNKKRNNLDDMAN